MVNILNEIWTLLCEMSPYLLLGFLLAGLMHEFVPGTVYTKHLGDRSLRSVVLAALFGVPLPLCSCGVIPTAMGIRKEGASRGATISFLIATPQTGVDSIIATYSLMGLPFAIIRPIVALVTAIFGGVLCNVTSPHQQTPSNSPVKGENQIQNPKSKNQKASSLRGGWAGAVSSPFTGESEEVFFPSPLKLNSTLVGGMQFSSLQAP